MKRHWDRRESKFHGEENKWVCSFFQQRQKRQRAKEIEEKKEEIKKFFLWNFFFLWMLLPEKNKYKENFLWCGIKRRRRKEENSFIDKGEEHTAQQQHTREKLWMNFEQENPLVTQIGIFGLRFNLPDSACHKLSYLVVSILCEINP